MPFPFVVDDEALRVIEQMDQDDPVDLLFADIAPSHPHDTGPAQTFSQSHYRRFADSFAEDADGVVQGWNGIDAPWRFENSIGAYETVGVVAPNAACTIGSSGSGQIVGQFYAFVRFIDRDGNISSLSPISNLLSAQSIKGSITGASFSSPIVISGISGMADGQIIKIQGVLGNTAANGIFNVQNVTGGLALYLDSSLTSPSVASGTYVSGGTAYTGVSSIIYSNVPVSTESRVVRRQILRNQDGDLTVFYVDVDTTDLTSTTFSSQTLSASLTDSVSLEDTSGHTLVDKSIPPNIKRFVAFSLGRMFATGNRSYSEGAAVVTNGSQDVTGIGTEWGALTFAGRYFHVVGDSKLYTIESCSSQTALRLTEAYEGSTNPYAQYMIHVGDGERRTFYFSEPAQPEAWPISNTLTISEDPNNGEITGLFPYRSYLYITTERRLWKFSFLNDPLLDGSVFKAANRGSVNNRCWVQTDDGVYMLDEMGIHVFSGNDDNDIGTPAVQDLFRLSPISKYRINWRVADTFHAVYSQGDAVIRWFVALNGNYAPQHAICYHIRLQRWWLEKYPWPVGASCVGRLNGRPQAFISTTGNRIMAIGQGTLDGPDPTAGTVRSTVTSSGNDWLADSTATFASSGIVGNPICIVEGRGKGQQRIVSAVSGARITVVQPWSIKPDTTSKYQLGGVQWNWLSGWYRWKEADYKNVRGLALQWKTLSEQAELFVRIYKDLSSDAATFVRSPNTLSSANGIGLLANDPVTDLSVDTTRDRGYVLFKMDKFNDWFTDFNRFVAVELNGVTNAEQLLFYRLTIHGAEPGQQK